MTYNLQIRFTGHAISQALNRQISFQSVLDIIYHPSIIEPGNKNLREVFTGIGEVEGKPYPVSIPVSAGSDGINYWMTIKSVIPKRDYKYLLEKK